MRFSSHLGVCIVSGLIPAVLRRRFVSRSGISRTVGGLRDKASTISRHGILGIACRISLNDRIHRIRGLLRGGVSRRISRLHARIVSGRRITDLGSVIVSDRRITVPCRNIWIVLCVEIPWISGLFGSLLRMITGHTGSIAAGILCRCCLGIPCRIILHAVLLSEICARISAVGIIALLGISRYILGIVSILIHSDSLSAS